MTMQLIWVITNADMDIEYFTCDVSGLAFGGSHIFVGDKDKALGFAREQDAQQFAERYLRGIETLVRRVAL